MRQSYHYGASLTNPSIDSGHSEQVENIDNTEEDGKDECQCPHPELDSIVTFITGLLPVDAKGKDDDNEVLMIRDDVRSALPFSD